MSDNLQFDKVEPTTSTTSTTAPAAITCAVCKRPVHGSYYEINKNIVDAACKLVVDAAHENKGTPAQRVLLASALGLGAAVAGAVVYWGITAATGWNIGLVAIAVGYAVGFAVRKGSRAQGGVGYQVLAVALTYAAVSWAFVPALYAQSDARGPVTAVLAVILSFAAPVISAVDSMPGGIISIAITFFGLAQAWRMNRKPGWDVKGPFTAP